MFEAKIRELLAKNPDAVQKSVLKVVLGDFQLKNCKGGASDQDGFNIVEKVIKGNTETIKLLPETDARRPVLIQENEFLATLLPKTATVEEVVAVLTEEVQAQIATAKNDGMATGILMKFAKSKGLNVKGDTAAQALCKIRC